LIRKYLEEAKVEVSSPRNENEGNWETASGKLNFTNIPSVPKALGHAWDKHPHPELVKFRKVLPIYNKRETILNAIESSKGNFHSFYKINYFFYKF
jgi:hypothetical protein